VVDDPIEMSADDVVSFNLKEARELRGWTQPEAATQVSKFLGKPWSVQVYGDAERAHRINRVKVFSADEIVALSRAFQLPIVWWFVPRDARIHITPRGGSATSATADELLSLLCPLESQMVTDLEGRTRRLLFVKWGGESGREPAGRLDRPGARDRRGDRRCVDSRNGRRGGGAWPRCAETRLGARRPGCGETAADGLRTWTL